MPRKPLFKSRSEEWIEERKDRMLSMSTVEAYEICLRVAFRFATSHDWPMNPKKVGPGHLRQYYEHLQTYSTGTQRQYINVLLMFLRWSGNGNFEDVKLRIRPTRSRVNWLSEEQVAMLIAQAPYPNLKAMVVGFAYTGMRLSELLTLRTRDMRPQEILIRGKGRKERTIPVNEEFWIEMDPYLKEREKYGSHETFLVHRSKRSVCSVSNYSDMGVYSAVIRYGLEAGIHTPPHTFRRSFGRHLYKRGCPLAELSYLMGHASVEQTVSYLGIGECDLQDAMSFRPNYREIAQKAYQLKDIQQIA